MAQLGMTTQARRALSGARYVLYARTTAATPKQAASANAKLNRIIHMSRYSNHRRERDSSLCHRRLLLMLEAAPYSSDCRGCLTFIMITSHG
jgi:hypothetical protein